MQYPLEVILGQQTVVRDVQILEAVANIELGSSSKTRFEKLNGFFSLEVNSQTIEELVTSVTGKVI
jgi:hypothetical protein